MATAASHAASQTGWEKRGLASSLLARLLILPLRPPRARGSGCAGGSSPASQEGVGEEGHGYERAHEHVAADVRGVSQGDVEPVNLLQERREAQSRVLPHSQHGNHDGGGEAGVQQGAPVGPGPVDGYQHPCEGQPVRQGDEPLHALVV